MNNRTLIGTLALLALLAPNLTFAVGTLQDALCVVGRLVGAATPIVAALALLAFFWGLTMYLFSLSGGSSAAHSAYGMPATPQGKQAGRTVMLYGIIVLFVMFSIWGLINILQVTFGLQNSGSTITPPAIGGAQPATITAPACH